MTFRITINLPVDEAEAAVKACMEQLQKLRGADTPETFALMGAAVRLNEAAQEVRAADALKRMEGTAETFEATLPPLPPAPPPQPNQFPPYFCPRHGVNNCNCLVVPRG